ncbi:hypothetical protein [Mesorhizobium silamurunense]|uniref:hypothetical protein n=1 Tax=Mesorhizobium silamurunense TaxID=499528 RepID=UPI001781949A|nr:hypothetical protein [Mesorhizobium silamurunense]
MNRRKLNRVAFEQLHARASILADVQESLAAKPQGFFLSINASELATYASQYGADNQSRVTKGPRSWPSPSGMRDIGHLFKPTECKNFFKAAGYEAN